MKAERKIYSTRERGRGGKPTGTRLVCWALGEQTKKQIFSLAKQGKTETRIEVDNQSFGFAPKTRDQPSELDYTLSAFLCPQRQRPSERARKRRSKQTLFCVFLRDANCVIQRGNRWFSLPKTQMFNRNPPVCTRLFTKNSQLRIKDHTNPAT